MELLARIEQLTEDAFPAGGPRRRGSPARIRCVTLDYERMGGVLPENTPF
jgi:hypothetical protein